MQAEKTIERAAGNAGFGVVSPTELQAFDQDVGWLPVLGAGTEMTGSSEGNGSTLEIGPPRSGSPQGTAYVLLRTGPVRAGEHTPVLAIHIGKWRTLTAAIRSGQYEF